MSFQRIWVQARYPILDSQQVPLGVLLMMMANPIFHDEFRSATLMFLWVVPPIYLHRLWNPWVHKKRFWPLMEDFRHAPGFRGPSLPWVFVLFHSFKHPTGKRGPFLKLKTLVLFYVPTLFSLSLNNNAFEPCKHRSPAYDFAGLPLSAISTRKSLWDWTPSSFP